MPLVRQQNDVQFDPPVRAVRPKGETPVDHSHLSRYTLNDRGLELEILRLFLAQVPLTIESLKFASMDKDWVVAAHTLKGSARAVGVTRLADLGLEAERLGGISDQAACSCLIVKIEAAAAEAKSYITSHYAT